ncbi:MAG: flagellar hook-associated protein FlgK [Pseudomonadota bacterium]|nr:flagellar hook-associated protein FlgK [Pseudomonadota bacterium]
MSLSAAFDIINSSFRAIGTQSSTIASNIANSNTARYSRQLARPVTDPFNGVAVYSISREADSALAAQLNVATSDSAAQSAISAGVGALAQTVSDSSSATSAGALQNGASPFALLANFRVALSTYQAQPTSLTAAQAAVTAAKSVATSLNAGASAVTQVRSQADQAIAQAVGTVNTLLGQFQTVDNSVVSGLASGANVGALQDKRDALVTQIAQQIGVSTFVNGNGSMSIFTDSGVTLYENAPSNITFAPSGTLGPNQTGAQVYVNGAPLTGPSLNTPLQSGAIAGLIHLRDTIAPQYQSQLDQVAGNLITAFQETDQSITTPGLPPLPGLFTTPGATSVPPSPTWTGVANAITINPNVDPAQGGNAFLLRDGGISDTANQNYTYNPSGQAGYTNRLSQMISALTSPMSFSSNAGLGASASLTDYASASVSWLQGANQQASGAAAYQNSLQTQASSALNNATGVNLDTELTNMLTIESSYTASAKLMTTVSGMLKTLVNAV